MFKRIMKQTLGAVALLGLGTSMANAALVSCAGSPANNVDTNPATVASLSCATGGAIQDLNLSVYITGGHMEDFSVALRHVASGTTVQVKNANTSPFGHQDAPINVTFDDEAAAAYWGSAGGPFIGAYQAANLLSAFNGLDVFGQWDLIILDAFVPGEGNDLLSWSIEAVTVPEPGSLALLGLGLTMVGFQVSRRKKKMAKA